MGRIYMEKEKKMYKRIYIYKIFNDNSTKHSKIYIKKKKKDENLTEGNRTSRYMEKYKKMQQIRIKYRKTLNSIAKRSKSQWNACEQAPLLIE